MKKKILIGSIIAVVILTLVSIAPSINALVKRDNEHYEKIIETGKGGSIENSNCLIRGEITNAKFCSNLYVLFGLNNLVIYPIGGFFSNFPYKLSSWISIGYSPDIGGTQCAQGWIWADGDNGVQEVDGELLGGIIQVHMGGGFAPTSYHMGVKGFRGIQKTDSDGVIHFEGYAREVKIYQQYAE